MSNVAKRAPPRPGAGARRARRGPRRIAVASC